MKVIVIGGAVALLLAAVPIVKQACSGTICHLPYRLRHERAQAGATEISKQVMLYLLDVGRSDPADDMDLSILLMPASQGGGANGPYLEKATDLLDPWNHPFVLRVPGQRNYTFDVVSYGADGQPGGEGEDKDITN